MIISELIKQMLFLATASTLVVFVIKSSLVCGEMKDRWKFENELRECGSQLSAIKNLRSAVDILVKRYPLKREVLIHRFESLASEISEGWVTQHCYSNILKSSVQVYRQVNPRMSVDWPNWSYFLQRERVF